LSAGTRLRRGFLTHRGSLSGLAPAWLDGAHSIYGVGPWRRYATAGHSRHPRSTVV